MAIDEYWLVILALTLLAGLMSGVPVMLALCGVPVLVASVASLFGHFDLSYLGAFPQRVFGIMNNSLLIAVPLFILMGVLLERSKVAENMLLTMAGFFKNSRSGLVYSVLIVSTLIAASTGIIGATIVMLGLISLPAMLLREVPMRLSCGLICASGTLGQIVPPSIVLILLGDQISNAYLEAQRNAGNFAPDTVSVGDLFAGALVPGLLLVLLYAAYVFLHGIFFAHKQPAQTVHLNDVPAIHTRSMRDTLNIFMPPVLLIVAVLGSILLGIATPTEAAAVGVAGTLLIAAAVHIPPGSWAKKLIFCASVSAFLLVLIKSMDWINANLNQVTGGQNAGNLWVIAMSIVLVLALLVAIVYLQKARVLSTAIVQTMNISAMVFGIIISASMLSLVFRGFSGDDIIENLLGQIPGDQWGALLAVMVVIFFLGFVLEFVEIVFIVIPIVGPVLLAYDFHPVWFAVLIALNLQTSFLTPPFGFALFYFRSVAPPSIKTTEIYLSVVPFVVIQIIAILLVLAFPALATWLPEHVF